MAAEKSERKVKRWRISKLKDHPQQAAMFGDVTDAELRDLANLLDKQGQREPLDILPDGTILAGHQRVRAAKLLGWAEIDVVVHHDLAEDEAAAETLFITDNLVRRQLAPLAQARAIKRLLELENPSRGANLEKLKAKIAEKFQLSTRSLNRYLALLATPPAVQRAVEAGNLTIALGGRVSYLKKEAQQEVARRIEAGEDPKKVVGEAEAKTAKPCHAVQAACKRLLRFSWDLQRIVKHRDQVDRHWLAQNKENIEYLIGALTGLLA